MKLERLEHGDSGGSERAVAAGDNCVDRLVVVAGEVVGVKNVAQVA